MSESNKTAESKENLIILWIAILIIVIVIGGYIFSQQYIIHQEQAVRVPEIILINKTVTTKVYDPISIKEYIENRKKYENKKIEIEGYLQHTVERRMYIGEDYYYIVDDEKNNITLTNITEELKQYFVKKAITTTPYKVTGVYNAIYLGQELHVTNIQESQRTYKEVQEIKEIQKEVGVQKTIITNTTLWLYLFEKKQSEVQI